MSFKDEKIVEEKTCRKCSTIFHVTDKDLEFYKKVSPSFWWTKYSIPTPTLCPDCRQQRRLSWRNESTLYKRKCDATEKNIISTFHADSPYTVYSQDYWWSDNWNAMDYGKEPDFDRPFFEQFSELLKQVPLINIMNDNNVASTNCDYSFDCWYSKNCYFVICAWRIEDSMYCNVCLSEMKDCIDCNWVMTNAQHCFECIFCKDINNCFYLQNSSSCHKCMLWFNLHGCDLCYGCTNLTNKKYCLFNEQLSEEQYKKEMENRNFKEDRERFEELKKGIIHKAQYQINSTNCTGDHFMDSKDCVYTFDGIRMKDCKYYFIWDAAKDCMDILISWECELGYENVTCDQWYMTRFSIYSCKDTNALYSQYCFGCKNIFWCIALRNKEYCIFNKQYTKQEYEKLVPKIIEKMERDSEWWEFFPSNISPFGYNESMAKDDYPLEERDYHFHWTDYYTHVAKVEKTIPAHKLPESIKDIPDDILNWAIECEITKKPFRIMEAELNFYRKHSTPIPRRHPDQRYADRLGMRNPRKLNKDNCDKCNKDIKTTYSGDRKETVYCEECYNNSIY